MSKEKRRVPKLRFPGFTEDWEQREFSDIFSEVKSGLSRMLSNDDIGLPVVRANNINDGQLNLVDDIKYWYKNDPQGANTNNYLIEQGDILINFINSEAKMGTAAYVTRRPERDTIYTTNILRCKVNDEYNPYFIYSLTFLNSYKNYIASITKPAVNQASFTTVDFKKYSIKIPTVKEQNQIADLIETFNKLITLHQRKLDNLKLKKKALLQKLFPKNGEYYPELRFPGFTDAWEQRKLGDVTNIKTGSRNQQDSVTNGQYPFFIRSEKIEKLDRYDFDTEAILVPGDGRIGEIFHYYNGKFALHQRVYKVDNFKGVDAFFLLYLFQCSFKEHALRLNAQGTVPSLRLPMFTEWNICIPSLQEQIGIGRLLNKIELMITLHQQEPFLCGNSINGGGKLC